MKTFFTLAFSFAMLVSFACNDHLYRLGLNQRSFYNPASLCPYCKGSTFFSTGFIFMPGNKNIHGDFFAVGCDGPNKLHGPWDISYTNAVGDDSRANGYSLRYAYEQKLNKKWRFSAGMRFSYVNMEQKFSGEGVSHSVKMSFADLDGGIFLTNQKGFYSGFAVQHIPAMNKKNVASDGAAANVNRDRGYNIVAGGIIPAGYNWDILAETNAMYDGKEYVAQLGAMFRWYSIVGIGGGVTYSRHEVPHYEVRGGITTSVFKMISSVGFTPDGISVETGMIIRFGADLHHPLIIHTVSSPCTGGSCAVTPPTKKKHKHGKDEFDPHQ
ncbi:MAG: type IX secretion system membrane protein PorP/SprF [Bacteroidetes bacterium]|nr:type IX secretion system membrane protein PorP/SprF [Bacteroidota bacterium]